MLRGTTKANLIPPPARPAGILAFKPHSDRKSYQLRALARKSVSYQVPSPPKPSPCTPTKPRNDVLTPRWRPHARAYECVRADGANSPRPHTRTHSASKCARRAAVCSCARS